MRVLLDADVMIGALDAADAHHGASRALFMRSRERQDDLAISVLSLTETLVAPAADVSKLAAAREAIAALGVAVHRPSEATAIEAARLRARHPISLADAYLLAGARHSGATVASFDRRVQQAAATEGLATV